MGGIDTDSASIVRDVVQFLESLGEIDLPLKIETARENLLQRTRTKLAAMTSSRGSTSPEPYLDMNAGKGLLQRNNSKHIEIEEYVGVEEKIATCAPFSSHQDYYESFNEFRDANVDKNADATSLARDEQIEDKLREIYRTFTRAETTSKAIKSGNVDQKIERKLFGLVRENIRPCWIGLVGTHLIIYGNNDDKQPPEVYSIKDYKARAAPNAVPKDLERAKSAFEIFCPGNKTLQFIARTPMEMKEWVDAIGNDATSVCARAADIRTSEETVETKRSEETSGLFLTSRKLGESASPTTAKTAELINVNGNEKASGSGSGKKKDSKASAGTSPPELPVRLVPRRLPSLPNAQVLLQPSYEPMDDGYEEDDIYHKIEDFSYENVKEKISGKKTRVKKTSKRKKSKETREASSSPQKQVAETYDDVQTIVRDAGIATQQPREVDKSFEETSSGKEELSLTYDDVGQTSCSAVSADPASVGKSCQTKIDRSPSKSPHKRWFILDRVIHRKESPKKEEKPHVEGKKSRKKIIDVKEKEKDKEKGSSDATISTSETNEILGFYDDVSELVNNKQKVENDDFSNYNCPPPPRPIYVKSTNQINVQNIKKNDDNDKHEEMKERGVVVEELYDDISNYRDNRTEELKEIVDSQCVDNKNCFASRVSATFEQENHENSLAAANRLMIDSEHYQTPRKNSRHLNEFAGAPHRQEEQELYDDVAIHANFCARQRELENNAAVAKPAVSAKRPWNRFGSGKKTANRDFAGNETTAKNNTSSSDLEDANEPPSILHGAEKQDAARMNKLQKLYNKMEFTLGKQPSGKCVNPLLSKTHKSE